jgi:hypothetical protein
MRNAAEYFQYASYGPNAKWKGLAFQRGPINLTAFMYQRMRDYSLLIESHFLGGGRHIDVIQLKHALFLFVGATNPIK